MKHDTWPQDKVDQLKILWPNNSAAVISKILGYSRGSIIGKVHRMKLTKKNEWKKIKPKEVKQPFKQPVRQPFKKSTKYIEYVPKPLPPNQSEPLHIKLMDLSYNHCRDVTGMDDDCLPTYCGHPIKTRSYCAEHVKRYFRKP